MCGWVGVVLGISLWSMLVGSNLLEIAFILLLLSLIDINFVPIVTQFRAESHTHSLKILLFQELVP